MVGGDGVKHDCLNIFKKKCIDIISNNQLGKVIISDYNAYLCLHLLHAFSVPKNTKK